MMLNGSTRSDKSSRLFKRQTTSKKVNNMSNDSDLAASVTAPDEIRQWNWGAFLFAPFWGVGNRIYLGILALIPLIGLVVAIILGIKGNEAAWRSKRWDSPKAFLHCQRKWSFWGWGILIASSLLYIVFERNIEGLWILIGALLIVGFFDTIFGKAGYRYSGGMSLLMFVPIANIVMLLIFVINE